LTGSGALFRNRLILKKVKKMPKAEGKVFPFSPESDIRDDFLETIDFKGEEKITISTDEFNAVCPFSGLPDFGELVIVYCPAGKIIELKSFKYYLTSFRNVGIYQEAAVEKIYQDMENALAPEKLYICLTYRTRGGLDTIVEKGEMPA